MIIPSSLRIGDLTQSNTTKKMVVAAADGTLSVFVSAPIPLTDPPDPAYIALPSGSVFAAELQIGSTTYHQLFIKP
jgi:hypothetical protein